MLVGDIPRRNAKLYPEKIGVVGGDTRLNFAQLNSRVNRLANALPDLGLNRGDRFAVLNPNCYQYVEFYFAAAKAGTPIVPLNYRYGKDELTHVLNDSGAGVLFFGSQYTPLVDQLAGEVETVHHVICIDDDPPNEKPEIKSDAKTYSEILETAPDSEPSVPSPDEDDTVVLGYTGGTTGRPKGVMTTHRNIIASCYHTVIERFLRHDTVFLNVPPLFHAGDANSMFAFSLLGATNVILDAFDPKKLLKTIETHRVTHVLLVPSMILLLLRFTEIEKYDLSSLQVVYYGTAPMAVEPLKKAMKAFGCGFSQTYGATETFVPISILKPEDHVLEGSEQAFDRMGSAGREVVGVEVKIVDENDNEVPDGEIGEVIVRGNNVMKGYWKLPEMTREALRNGWYHTGDMGKMDSDRYLYIVDRKNDMIISGGENISAKEIENVLFTHPAVADAAVIGVPDDIWGEAVKALVIKKEGLDVGEDELIDHCKNRLASYKKPKSIDFVDELPRSTAGKVLKRVLRDAYGK
jgi:long-chain acyl-CoA synthetase